MKLLVSSAVITHCRGNIKRKLQELGIPSESITEYLFEIFRGQRGATHVEGLVDALSDADFDKKLSVMEQAGRRVFLSF